ncbi:hypothetical protein FORC066_0573 [Yersinia enterocolitica]|nr:hypothetical protein FORC065_3906 [Yersinia enterocolitica]UXD27793.1 hypothetical protein FORC066_0573 [Yersinia enterocolitica]
MAQELFAAVSVIAIVGNLMPYLNAHSCLALAYFYKRL